MGVNTLDNYYDAVSKQIQKAELQIWGDPDISFDKPIAVSIPTPWGVLYPTSGIWTIVTVTDEISAGQYSTNLSLIRRAGDFGVKLSRDRVVLSVAVKKKKKG